MKKAYIVPSIVNVNIHIDTLLQTGSTLNGQQGSQNVSVGFTDTEYNGESAANGSGGFWDDDDED